MRIGSKITIFSEMPVTAIIKKLPNEKGAFVAECTERLILGPYMCMDETELLDIHLVKQEKNICVFVWSSEMENEDKRQFARHPYNKEVQITDISTKNQAMAVAKDISGSGIGLLCPQPIQKNSVIVINLPVMVLPGEVCWVKREDDNYHFGVSFNIDEDERNIVLDHINEVTG